MAIKCGFYGGEAYDLIHYVSRVLLALGHSIVLIDQSQDRALESSIALPVDYNIENDQLVEYRGVMFAGRYMKTYDKHFDYIFLYYGRSKAKVINLDWLVIINDGDARTNNKIEGIMKVSSILLENSKATKKDDCYVPKEPICLSLSPMAKNVSFEQFNRYPVSRTNMDTAVIDTDDLILKHCCQVDGMFKFNGISSDYNNIIEKLSESFLEKEVSAKDFKKAYKLAERGK